MLDLFNSPGQQTLGDIEARWEILPQLPAYTISRPDKILNRWNKRRERQRRKISILFEESIKTFWQLQFILCPFLPPPSPLWQQNGFWSSSPFVPLSFLTAGEKEKERERRVKEETVLQLISLESPGIKTSKKGPIFFLYLINISGEFFILGEGETGASTYVGIWYCKVQKIFTLAFFCLLIP